MVHPSRLPASAGQLTKLQQLHLQQGSPSQLELPGALSSLRQLSFLRAVGDLNGTGAAELDGCAVLAALPALRRLELHCLRLVDMNWLEVRRGVYTVNCWPDGTAHEARHQLHCACCAHTAATTPCFSLLSPACKQDLTQLVALDCNMAGCRAMAADGDLGSLHEGELNAALGRLTGVRQQSVVPAHADFVSDCRDLLAGVALGKVLRSTQCASLIPLSWCS